MHSAAKFVEHPSSGGRVLRISVKVERQRISSEKKTISTCSPLVDFHWLFECF